MNRLVTAPAGAGLMLPLAPPAVSSAASNTATTLFPLTDGTQLETFVRLDCHHANGSCDFTVGADRRAGDGVTGFPNDLWSRQSTTIRPSDRADLPGCARHRPVRPGQQRRRFRRSHHHLHGRRAAGEVSDRRPDRLDELADRATQSWRQRHRLHAHPGGLQRGQHHLAEHLRAS